VKEGDQVSAALVRNTMQDITFKYKDGKGIVSGTIK